VNPAVGNDTVRNVVFNFLTAANDELVCCRDMDVWPSKYSRKMRHMVVL
jgi:hypothetical protein